MLFCAILDNCRQRSRFSNIQTQWMDSSTLLVHICSNKLHAKFRGCRFTTIIKITCAFHHPPISLFPMDKSNTHEDEHLTRGAKISENAKSHSRRMRSSVRSSRQSRERRRLLVPTISHDFLEASQPASRRG